jgi:hypothetical protein
VKTGKPYVTFEHREVAGTGALGEDGETVHHVWGRDAGSLQTHQRGRLGLLHSRLRARGRQNQPDSAHRRCSLPDPLSTCPTSLHSASQPPAILCIHFVQFKSGPLPRYSVKRRPPAILCIHFVQCKSGPLPRYSVKRGPPAILCIHFVQFKSGPLPRYSVKRRPPAILFLLKSGSLLFCSD